MLFILAITIPTTTTGIGKNKYSLTHSFIHFLTVVKLGKEQYSCYGNVLGRVSLTKGGDDVKLLKVLLLVINVLN